ncbi:serine protease [Streptomyces sp. RB6PN25]|uniref:Serine protease n=1 Tax=Streptomyces humicola TaxID=2953240 RepID=A0ABT1PUW2_9ACTN|nr:trypsin-like peptidase domain-containing protein [Streptomyces humicola]MCQ4080332.1 serine protease [Streptomyces humicola]
MTGEAQARLRDLARQAAVAVQADPHDEASEFWGSGLLIAPHWVLTCAHVLMRRDSSGRRRWVGGGAVGVRIAGRLFAGRAVYALPHPESMAVWDRDDERGADLAPDLALIRLTEEAPHSCAWLSDRAVPPVSSQVAAYGWRRPAGDRPLGEQAELEAWDGTCTVPGNDRLDVFRLGPDSEIPDGVSGGLVVDLAHGRVVGVVKARRRSRDGGKAVLLTALRDLAASEPLVPELAPGPDPYQELVRAHDLWHYQQQRPRPEARATWIDVQGRLSDVIGEWSPFDRAKALGLLAALPPPRGGGVVQRLVERVLGPGTVRDPLPVAWRDGHGLLYEPEDGKQLLAFLIYLVLVADEVSGQDPDRAAELKEWALDRGLALPAADRTRLVELARSATASATAHSSVLVALAPVVWEENRPVRFRWEIQLVHAPDHRQIAEVCDERDGVAFDEAVRQVQAPLAIALDRADESGSPAAVEIALPVHHFDTRAHLWTPGRRRAYAPARPMGARRPVVVRDVERVPPPVEWLGRWAHVAGLAGLKPLPLNVIDRSPGYELLRGAPAEAVPVLCGPVGQGEGLLTMVDALDAGHGLALWRTADHPPDACGPDCVAFRREADALLAGVGAAADLPEAVRKLRAYGYDARPERGWVEDLVLLYDDAHLPLPGLTG